MAREGIRELVRRDVDANEHTRIRELWKKHSIAEDARDLSGLISTLTEDCVERVSFRVVIFFPWDAKKQKFKGEKVYVHPESLLSGRA